MPEVINPAELARRIVDGVDDAIEAVAAVCDAFVPADERETVCGSYLYTTRRVVQTLYRWAPNVGTSDEDAARFARLVDVVLTTSRDVANDLRARGWAGRWSVMIENVAPALLSDLESLARVVQATRKELTDAADALSENPWLLRGAIGTVVLVVVGGVALYFVGPRLLGVALDSRRQNDD